MVFPPFSRASKRANLSDSEPVLGSKHEFEIAAIYYALEELTTFDMLNTLNNRIYGLLCTRSIIMNIIQIS